MEKILIAQAKNRVKNPENSQFSSTGFSQFLRSQTVCDIIIQVLITSRMACFLILLVQLQQAMSQVWRENLNSRQSSADNSVKKIEHSKKKLPLRLATEITSRLHQHTFNIGSFSSELQFLLFQADFMYIQQGFRRMRICRFCIK